MSDIFYFTKKQFEIEKWISSLGFRVKLEVDVENYRVDIVVSELNFAIEIDGPSHRKLPIEGKLVTLDSSDASKRDKVLLQYFRFGIWHIPVSIDRDTFEKKFREILRLYEEKFI